MTIEELAAATGLTANDLLGIWDTEASGSTEPTQKITAQQLAAAVKVLANLQGALTFDTTPTTGSTNPVTSDGIKTAIEDRQHGSAIGALLTDRSQYFEYHYAMQFGGIVILSFLVKDGATNGTTLCKIDNSIKPSVGDYIAPLFYGNGQMNTQASVWIEHGNTTLVKYYGATATAGAYVTLIYGIE